MPDLTPAEVRAAARWLRITGTDREFLDFIVRHVDVLLADPEPPTPTDEDAQEAGGR